MDYLVMVVMRIGGERRGIFIFRSWYVGDGGWQDFARFGLWGGLSMREFVSAWGMIIIVIIVNIYIDIYGNHFYFGEKYNWIFVECWKGETDFVGLCEDELGTGWKIYILVSVVLFCLSINFIFFSGCLYLSMSY
jgi:hypothetical protein